MDDRTVESSTWRVAGNLSRYLQAKRRAAATVMWNHCLWCWQERIKQTNPRAMCDKHVALTEAFFASQGFNPVEEMEECLKNAGSAEGPESE